MRANPFAEARRNVEAASAALIKAAHALQDPTRDGKACALLYTASALMFIAKSDPERAACDRAVEVMERIRIGKAE